MNVVLSSTLHSPFCTNSTGLDLTIFQSDGTRHRLPAPGLFPRTGEGEEARRGLIGPRPKVEVRVERELERRFLQTDPATWQMVVKIMKVEGGGASFCPNPKHEGRQLYPGG